jgi:hypothetical protein
MAHVWFYDQHLGTLANGLDMGQWLFFSATCFHMQCITYLAAASTHGAGDVQESGL